MAPLWMWLFAALGATALVWVLGPLWGTLTIVAAALTGVLVGLLITWVP